MLKPLDESFSAPTVVVAIVLVFARPLALIGRVLDIAHLVSVPVAARG